MTDEPYRFRSREHLEHWGAKKVKEFKWLEHKINTAGTPTAKDKAVGKMADWMGNHPKLADQILKNTLKNLEARKA